MSEQQPGAGEGSATPSVEKLQKNQEKLTEHLQDDPAVAKLADATGGEVAGQPGQ